MSRKYLMLLYKHIFNVACLSRLCGSDTLYRSKRAFVVAGDVSCS